MRGADRRPPAIFLMGPTASGKTALACRLADRFNVELVSVDSALVYRGLDLGAAKPDAAMLARYPHRLIDIRESTQPYSAADFRDDALAAMRGISGAGRVPLLVGGTGLISVRSRSACRRCRTPIRTSARASPAKPRTRAGPRCMRAWPRVIRNRPRASVATTRSASSVRSKSSS
jgi:hypothetical protein